MGVIETPLIVDYAGKVLVTLPRPFAQMLTKNQKGLEESFKSLQPTPVGVVSSADAGRVIVPAWLSFC